ncbi:MAG: hypothetical protein Q4G27_09585 [Flavobacteriaceae bacterium]|nr:hypothetical protein [Flavobacteriaceae bacterium]
MKGIGKILLYIFAALAIIGFIWVLFTPGSASADLDKREWVANPLTTYMIIVSLITFVLTLLAFAYFKVVDLFKHPSHMREAIWVLGAILVSVIIGFVLGGSDEIANNFGESYAGTKSRLIGMGIISTGVLLFVGTIFLIWDTVKGFIKA